MARVWGEEGVLGETVGFVGGADGEDEEEGESRAGDEREEVWVRQGVDVMDGERAGDT